jgi:uncharacterized protein (TIGR00661 family)
VYITDEGFGPIVRQNAIITQLQKMSPGINFTCQLEKHLDHAKKVMPQCEFVSKYNNITWHKTADGFPDIAEIKKQYSNYEERSDAFIKTEIEEFDYDFVISDLVYEAFEVAGKKKVPAFGVAHFTWDWFFSKLYPLPLRSSLIDRFLEQASQATAFYFPPFTPREILNQYKNIGVQVPLIVGEHNKKPNVRKENKRNVLIMDSGSGVLHQQIKSALVQLDKLKDYHFFVSSQFGLSGDNITLIDSSEFFIDYIPQMDLVIGRAGFNTISECIALKTPMLLLSEAMNPEMNENIINIKYEGLGSFISLDQFTVGFENYLPRFFDAEYRTIYDNIKNHTLPCNGAEVVAADILNRLKND